MTQLLLLPNCFEEGQPKEVLIPPKVEEEVRSLKGLIAESEKMGRRYLRKFGAELTIPILTLNEHTKPEELQDLLDAIKPGEKWGLISDAGVPCIADPGAALVRNARKRGIEIRAYPGPCSIILALQLSGFNAQRFSFHGYLPRDLEPLKIKVHELEKRVRSEEGAQVWIEAPYRSAKMLEFLKGTLSDDTQLCVAVNLTLDTERCMSQKISGWKKTQFPLAKEPTVFLIGR